MFQFDPTLANFVHTQTVCVLYKYDLLYCLMFLKVVSFGICLITWLGILSYQECGCYGYEEYYSVHKTQKGSVTGSVPRLKSFIDICMHFEY